MGTGDGDSKTSIGTPGLWELIVSKQSSSDIYTLSDLENYHAILINTSALKRNNNPNEVYPKSNKSVKWMNLIQPIWQRHYPRPVKSNELDYVIFLPSDPSALLQRSDLLIAS
jgi:hypothetical protein